MGAPGSHEAGGGGSSRLFLATRDGVAAQHQPCRRNGDGQRPSPVENHKSGRNQDDICEQEIGRDRR